MFDAAIQAPAFTGAKLPLKPMHVWGIGVRLQVEGRIRDLALFDLAIDSELRSASEPNPLPVAVGNHAARVVPVRLVFD